MVKSEAKMLVKCGKCWLPKYGPSNVVSNLYNQNISIAAAVISRGRVFYLMHQKNNNCDHTIMFMQHLFVMLDNMNHQWKKSVFIMVDNASYRHSDKVM